MTKQSKPVFLFYKYEKSVLIEIDARFNYNFFNPSLFNLKLHEGSVLIYLFWYIFTLGRYKIFYIFENQNIVHFSNVLPKIFKYSFMRKEDIQIANCYTDPLFRGNQLYPFALSIIAEEYADNAVWVGSRSDNSASLSGIKKAGYILISKVYKSMFLGIYRLSNDE